MQKEILLEIVKRNQSNCYYTFNNINTENERFRLNEKTASVGFIYRHIGETIHILNESFGIETNVENTTIGKEDSGEKYDLEMSRKIMDQGFNTLENIIQNASDEAWLEEIESAFFGNISRIALLSVILFHNSHHCGQIASAIIKGSA